MEDKKFGEEQRLVVNAFQCGFADMKAQKIVLYGIGENTGAILQETKDFEFCGLMDQNTTGQIVFQKKVLSEDEVIKIHPIIVIIARESVIGIIFERIRHLQVQHGIKIYNYKGELLGQGETVYQNEELDYWGISEKDLVQEIKKHDVISFDIFDTLLMRRVLQPEDVFALVEEKLNKKGVVCSFQKKRIEAEHLSGYCPNLDEIYDRMANICGWSDKDKEEIKTLERTTDSDMIVPRKKMCQLFRTAVKMGKKIYLLSDMYYPQKDMEELLAKYQLTGYEALLVSCDIRKQKSDGTLYKWFLSQYRAGGKCLHIGDNRRADIEKARENGLDSFQIYSAYEMLMASALQDILADITTIREKCILGLIISEIFNDPFAMYGTRGYYRVNKVNNIGYSFVGPYMMEYMQWFCQTVRENRIEQVLFPSRDGYLIQKIYRLQDELVPNVYFRTSRRAVTVAGIYDSQDIQRVAQRTYYGNYKDFLKSRFGIEMRKDDKRALYLVNKRKDLLMQVLEDYEKDIFEEAQKERRTYLEYLDKKGILNKRRQAIFDFVASGTVQYNLGKILQKDLKGMYFATMNLPNSMYEDDTDMIDTAYGNIQSYGTNSNLAKYYLFLETILIDEKATFSHMDDGGKEVYEVNNVESCTYRDIKKLQRAVMHYCTLWVKFFCFLQGEKPELHFADQLFGMLFSSRCKVADSVKNTFYNDDVYDGVSVYSLWPDESV